MPTNQPTDVQPIDRAQEAARNIFVVLKDEGLSAVEKVAVRKQLDQLIRLEIDESIASLQQLRSSF